MRLTTLALTSLSTLAPLALAAPQLAKRADSTTTTDGASVSNKTFDYVIAGGGLGGVVLASRLSEDPNVTVLVIEAGTDQENNEAVFNSTRYRDAFNTDADWAYNTTNQSSADSYPQTMRSGRGLGGSTLINGMAWSKPHDFQIDALEAVGNAGLNWKVLQSYMQKVEAYSTPNDTGITYSAGCHGTDGPIPVMNDATGHPTDLEHNFNATGLGLHMPYPGDLTCGNPAGLSPIAHTNKDNIRSDAYRGYLLGKDRPNLTVLTSAHVGRVILSDGDKPRATGVEFRDANGRTYTVNANREVLVALGSIQSPVILQNSGIGPTKFLDAAGVESRVALPVGQNLIDQTTSTTNWEFRGERGGGQPLLFPRFEDLFTGADAAKARAMLESKLDDYVKDAVQNDATGNENGLRKVLEVQRDWILNKSAGISESFDYSYDTTLGYDSWFLLPFGRGSIKITSNNTYSTNYAIDPRYFANEFDTLASAATIKFTRTFSEASPLSSQIVNETSPSKGLVPANASLDDWTKWMKTNYRSNWHPIGTVAMMSQDLGGCVDANHKVYGVDALRVVDGSNLPFQVSSHLMSVLYGLAERAAEIIKNEAGGSNQTATAQGNTGSNNTGSNTGSNQAAPQGSASNNTGSSTGSNQAAPQGNASNNQLTF